MSVLHILVKNSASENVTFEDPLVKNDLMSAIFQAYENATEFNGLDIEIVMETGSHYILPRYIEKYNTKVHNDTHLDMSNPIFNLTIRPLICEEQLSYGFNYGSWAWDNVTNTTTTNGGTNQTLWRTHNSSYCKPQFAQNQLSPESSSEVYLFNKVGAFFKIQIPQRLKWMNIIYDALDSIQDYNFVTADIAQRDCLWTLHDDKPHCPALLQAGVPPTYKENQICHYRNYDSIFQYRTIDRKLENETEI